MNRVLFVCTGNIFRSLTAEYALRAALRDSGREIVVESAGTEDFPHVVKSSVARYLADERPGRASAQTPDADTTDARSVFAGDCDEHRARRHVARPVQL